MKRFGFVGLLLCSMLVFGDDGSSVTESINPITPLSGPGCKAGCEAVLTACRQQCEDTTARADDEHFDEKDVSVDTCIRGCEADASICRQDC